MKVHAGLLHRKSVVTRIDPGKIELDRAAFKADKTSPVGESEVEAVQSEVEVVVPEPELVEAVQSEAEAVEVVAAEPEPVVEPVPEAPVVPVHLLSLSAGSLADELSTGQHDGFLTDLLKAEEAGRNRKGIKAKLEDRIITASKV